MRVLLCLAALLLAGCASEPNYAPLEPRAETPAEEPTYAPLQMRDCISSESRIPLPDQEATPPGVRPQPSVEVGPVQMYTFWALTCIASNETTPATLFLGLMDVEVDAQYDGEGSESWVVATLVDAASLVSWFAEVGLVFEAVPIEHGHDAVAGVTRSSFSTEGLRVDAVTVDGTPEPQVTRRLLFGDTERVWGAMDLVTTEHGVGSGAGALTFLELGLALPGQASAGRVGQATATWVAFGQGPPAPNP